MYIFNDNQENDNILSNSDSIKQEQKNQQSIKNILSEFNNNNAKKINFNNKRNKSLKNLIHDDNSPNEITTETKTEKDEFGNDKIICIRYDKNHKIISKKITYKNNNGNNNISTNDNNNNINNNYHREFFKASNGFTLETITERLANGRKKEKKIMRDDNNKIIEVKEREIPDNSNRRNNDINFNINNRVRHANHNMNNNNNNNVRILPINNNMYNMRRNINHNGQMPNPYMNRRNLNNRMMNNNPVNNMNNMNNFMRNNMNYMNNLPNPFMNNQFMNMIMPFPIPFPLFHRNDVNRVDQNILNSLPESEVKDASKMDDENKNCVICLEDFVDKEKIICLPCIHVFHSECIKSWLESHNECPICKYKLTYENINRH